MEVREILQPLARTLAADDFQLAVEQTGERAVTLTVTAGPSACADCLVPQDITRRLAVKHLGRPEWTVEVIYPSDAQ
jgi:hypothetical protein